jgi:excisionase family DNA binding protein
VAKKRLLSIKDVAEILNVSERTVRNLVKRKELAAPRKVAGKLARWFNSDVVAYLVRLRDQIPDGNLSGRTRQEPAPRGRTRQSDSEGSAGS